jgi:hypothetical protein
MTTFTARHFDTLEYVKQAKKLGTSEELAEFQAKQIEQAIVVAVSQIESKELATKNDIKELELQISQTSNKIILWVCGLFVASGLLQHFFK